uniref:Uncharacterized protein n=1 Tax=Anguilla anguilla TaxID=7936 RepID=A0A0E9QD33_ANGAN
MLPRVEYFNRSVSVRGY